MNIYKLTSMVVKYFYMAQLNFKGKQFVQNHHLVVPYHELIPQKDKSLTDKVNLHDNLILHGDNLLALKTLLPTYAGKVKCIYIDPPYNTGNEKWVYNDNVNSPMMQDWLGKVVDKEDLTRHDKWLCMMTPRLKLLRELLQDDGVIFISIDDNEVHHLRMLMDEIFGEENFIENIVWKKRSTAPNDRIIGNIHEYILIYSRSSDTTLNLLPRSEENLRRYSNLDSDPRGAWVASDLSGSGKGGRMVKSLVFPIENPNNNKEYFPPKGKCWLYNKSKVEDYLKEGKISFRKSGAPFLKRYLKEVRQGLTTPTIWLDAGVSFDSAKEINDIFHKNVFDNPKPSSLLKRIVKLATKEDDLVLDSFAGSGTTAHAVLQLNKEDGGDRKFILVEMEEYADKITVERVRRVIKGYGDQGGVGGTFSYFDLGKPIEIESLLSGENLPSYTDLARYVFYTATGEEFDESKISEENNFIGESKEYEVYLFYKPDLEYLKNTALTLDRAKSLGKINEKRRLVFAPTKYLDQEHLDELKIDFAQLPFEIYKLAK